MYLWIIIIGAGIMLSLLLLLLGCFISKKSEARAVTLSPFECGFGGINFGRPAFCNRFFVIALVFLVFDVELIILYPYMAGSPGGIEEVVLGILLNLLTLGFYYEFLNSAFDWLVFIK